MKLLGRIFCLSTAMSVCQVANTPASRSAIYDVTLGPVIDPTDKPSNAESNTTYDLSRFGLFAGPMSSISCSTTSGSKSASCLGGTGDFAVGQGIELPLAGTAPTFAPWGVATISYYSRSGNVATLQYTGPTFGAGQTIRVAGLPDSTFNGVFTVAGNDGNFGHISMVNDGPNVGTTSGSGTATLTSEQVVVTPQGILNGTSRYSYKVVLRGYHGELSVASNAGTTTTGAAALGVNSVTLSSCSRSDGVAICTTSSKHNFQSNVPVNVSRMVGRGASFYDGAHVIVATPSLVPPLPSISLDSRTILEMLRRASLRSWPKMSFDGI
jgi:hypothetical protein